MQSPRCPSCGDEWSKSEQTKILTAKFVGTVLRKRRREADVARELSRLNSTQPEAQRELLRRKQVSLTEQLTRSLSRLAQDSSEERMVEAQQLRMELVRVGHALQSLIATHRQHPSHAQSCPCAHGNCHGYADASTGRCTACQRHTCIRCATALSLDEVDHHVCKPDTLLSVQAISENCRPCASCSAMTQKVEGCPVMWCAHCHSFWHWDTREVIHSRGSAPHNPDHRAWLAENRSVPPPRELGDVPCGGVPAHHEVNRAVADLVFDADHFSLDDLIHVGCMLLRARSTIEQCHHRVRPMYPVLYDDSTVAKDLRIQLLLGDVRRPEFEKRLEQRMAKVRLHQKVGPVLETATFAGIDILLRLVNDTHTSTEMIGLYMEMDSLRSMINEELAKVQDNAGRKVPRIGEDWAWVLPYARKR